MIKHTKAYILYTVWTWEQTTDENILLMDKLVHKKELLNKAKLIVEQICAQFFNRKQSEIRFFYFTDVA
jgi:hypothetical protein